MCILATVPVVTDPCPTVDTGHIVWTAISVVIIVALGAAFGVLLAYDLYLKNEMKTMGSKPVPPNTLEHVSAGGDIKI